MSEEALLAEKTKRTFSERDRAERQEERRRREEWEVVENSALGGGLRKMPADKKRSAIGDSTVGGVSPNSVSTPRPQGLAIEFVGEVRNQC